MGLLADVCVSTMNGSNVTAFAVPSVMVLATAFVPHQSLVMLSVDPPPTTGISRFLPLGALLPANRLKCRFTVCWFAPSQMPPPPGVAPAPPAAELPLIVTLDKVRLSPVWELNKIPPALPPLVAPPPAVPAWLFAITVPVSIVIVASRFSPPPSPAAWFPLIVLACIADATDGSG